MAHHEAVSSFSGDGNSATRTLTSEAAPGSLFTGNASIRSRKCPSHSGLIVASLWEAWLSENRRGVWGLWGWGVAVTFPSHPNGPVNRACECTPLRYWRTNSPPSHFPPAFPPPPFLRHPPHTPFPFSFLFPYSSLLCHVLCRGRK